MFSVLYSFWVARYAAFDCDAVRELATQCLALAEKQTATVPLMIGHRIMGSSLLLSGEITEARAHLDQAIAFYDPAEHRPLAMHFGVDVGVASLQCRSWALWGLGYPDAALANSEQALKSARKIGNATTLMPALVWTSLPHIHCGNYTAANLQATEVVAMADAKGTLVWKAWAMINQGYASVLTGKASEAIQMITAGIAAWRSTGGTSLIPFYSTYLARAYAEARQFDDAWRCIGEAEAAVERTKEKWCEGELHRIAGEIALMSPEPDAAKARFYFERALTASIQQRAKSWELRAAMSMARLLRDQGRRDEARELLAPVYGWFTEGFETLDLKEAKALLDELA